MRLFKIMFFILIYLAVICVNSCTKQPKQAQNVVATVGNDFTITFDDLKSFVIEWHYTRKYKNIDEAFNSALDAMVTRQLKRIDFFRMELDNDESLILNIRRSINEELVSEYYTAQYVEKYSDEIHARKVYESMDKKVTYRKLLFQLPQNATNAQIDSIHEKAKKVKAEIENGKDFNIVAQQYSQSSVVFGHFTIEWEQAIANAIDEVVFKMNAGEVRIFSENDGFHLIQISDVQRIKVEPFEKIKKNIIAKLKNLNIDKKYQDFENDKKELIDESSLLWNEIAIRRLVDWVNDPQFFTERFYSMLQQTVEEDNFTILSYTNGKIDLKEYLYLLNNVLALKPPTKVENQDIKNYILEAIRTDIIVQKAKSLGLEKNIFNAHTTNPVMKDQIVNLYNAAVIDSQIPKPTTEMLREFYHQQKDSLYYQLSKVNIYAMIFSDEREANEIMQKISDGTPFEKISGNWFVKTFIRDREGNSKSYFSPEKPFLGIAAFKLNLNETSGPVKYKDPEKGEQYAIIKCVNLRPEKQLLFDDVKNSIAEDFVKYQREKLMREAKDRLWKQYDIKIYKDVLSSKLKSK
jgi:hypothetical protein